jgi:hypothetical protein
MGSIVVRLQRSGGYLGEVSIQYATSDGTATAGSDYTTTTGTLTWPAGDATERTFTVPVATDTQNENDESLVVTLSNPNGGASIEGAATFNITITNGGGSAAPPPSSGGGGGGGGVIGGDLLLLLLSLFGLARRKST